MQSEDTTRGRKQKRANLVATRLLSRLGGPVKGGLEKGNLQSLLGPSRPRSTSSTPRDTNNSRDCSSESRGPGRPAGKTVRVGVHRRKRQPPPTNRKRKLREEDVDLPCDVRLGTSAFTQPKNKTIYCDTNSTTTTTNNNNRKKKLTAPQLEKCLENNRTHDLRQRKELKTRIAAESINITSLQQPSAEDSTRDNIIATVNFESEKHSNVEKLVVNTELYPPTIGAEVAQPTRPEDVKPTEAQTDEALGHVSPKIRDIAPVPSTCNDHLPLKGPQDALSEDSMLSYESLSIPNKQHISLNANVDGQHVEPSDPSEATKVTVRNGLDSTSTLLISKLEKDMSLIVPACSDPSPNNSPSKRHRKKNLSLSS